MSEFKLALFGEDRAWCEHVLAFPSEPERSAFIDGFLRGADLYAGSPAAIRVPEEIGDEWKEAWDTDMASIRCAIAARELRQRGEREGRKPLAPEPKD